MLFRFLLIVLLFVLGARFLRAVLALRSSHRDHRSESIPGGVGGKEEIQEAQWKELDR
jgi:hypothetical protein